MPEEGFREPEEQKVRARVFEGFDEARQFAKTLDLDAVKNGEWFVELLRKVIYAYDRNARAEYFQKKYPGLSPDEIADILTSVTARYAAVAGGVAGAATTSAQVSTLGTFGMTTPLFLGAIGSEMIYLARIQMRLVLDLSVVYDLQLDPEDPEDVLMVFGYALGVTPTDLVGKGVQKAAGAGTEWLIKKYVSKGTLEALKKFANRLGFKILQRTIIKYTVPVASAAVGSSYNYATTRSMGRIAKAHFQNRGKMTEELRTLLSRRNTYDLVFPAAALYMAHLDGELSPKERELYKAMLSRMSLPEHEQAEFRRLVDDEANLIEATAGIEDGELRRDLMDVLALMAVCDGELAEREREFLTVIAGRMEVPLNLDEIEKSTQSYRMTVKRNLAAEAASSVKDTATMAGGRVRGVLGKVLKRKTVTDAEEPPAPEASTIVCSDCGREVPVEYQFCPDCGRSTANGE